VRDTSTRGDITEFEVAAALMRAGRRVLRPLSSSSRYDLLIDNEDGTFTRVQCKTGVLRRGGIVFRVYSVSGHNARGKTYQGQVDAFGVYSPATRRAYLVPMRAIALRNTMVCLRVTPARNGQLRRVNSADAFLIDG
jgi:hypothetical protein